MSSWESVSVSLCVLVCLCVSSYAAVSVVHEPLYISVSLSLCVFMGPCEYVSGPPHVFP